MNGDSQTRSENLRLFNASLRLSLRSTLCEQTPSGRRIRRTSRMTSTNSQRLMCSARDVTIQNELILFVVPEATPSRQSSIGHDNSEARLPWWLFPQDAERRSLALRGIPPWPYMPQNLAERTVRYQQEQ